MLAKTFSAAISGVDAFTVEIEINATGKGQPTVVSIVGLPDAAVKESRDRIRSAMGSCGYIHPKGTTVVNLAPADVKKEGASFDLPIATGMIAATGIIDRNKLARAMLVGELALDGGVRPVKGMIPIALHARKSEGIEALLVPAESAMEAAMAAGKLPVYAVRTLADAVGFFKDSSRFLPVRQDDVPDFHGLSFSVVSRDFSEVKGQGYAKRALEVAATGGHNVLMVGAPGTGKSMLAKRVPGILPPMHVDEALESSKIHSVMGLLPSNIPFLTERPYRAPHHTISDAGLLGGQTVPTPGEISLAHNGVLFMDELPEFKRNVLEVLRQPLENGEVTISRAAGSFTFPARFMLIAAMNPCPCGHYGDAARSCRCTPPQIQRYRARISGPLLDRIDIHVELSPLGDDVLLSAPTGETSSEIRRRVVEGRKVQNERFSGTGIFCNSQMEPAQLQRYCSLDQESMTYLRHSIRELRLSARAYDRILRVARTIADLKGAEQISTQDLFEAVQYRDLDKRMW
ncbi:MAG: YifB family Mg chelatase-like AAA ATPase [Victivallales bacterium]|nr:YifB family Mg chelatase-like AAA ATPase [Victivallales bacterium]